MKKGSPTANQTINSSFSLMHVPIPANIQNERNAGNTVVAPIRNAHTSVNDVTRMDTP